MRPWLYSSRKWLLCGTLMVRSTFLLVGVSGWSSLPFWASFEILHPAKATNAVSSVAVGGGGDGQRYARGPCRVSRSVPAIVASARHPSAPRRCGAS